MAIFWMEGLLVWTQSLFSLVPLLAFDKLDIGYVTKNGA